MDERFDRWQQPYIRGIKISVSFSCPSELLTHIEDYKLGERCNMSKAIVNLLVYGFIYRRILEEQRLAKVEETPKPPKQKKGKPKTSSK